MVVLALVIKMAEWKLRHGPKDVIDIDDEDDMTEEKGEGCWFRKIQKRRLLAQEKQKEVASRLSFACRQKLEKAEEKAPSKSASSDSSRSRSRSRRVTMSAANR